MYRDESNFASGETTVTSLYPPIPIEPKPQPWLFPHADDTKRLLIAAYALIRQGWTKGQHATDQNDRMTNWDGDDAYNYCAMGAIMRANMKLPAPRLLGWYWRRRRYTDALRTMCLAINAHNTAADDEDRVVLIEKWNDYAHYTERDVGFTVAIAIA